MQQCCESGKGKGWGGGSRRRGGVHHQHLVEGALQVRRQRDALQPVDRHGEQLYRGQRQPAPAHRRQAPAHTRQVAQLQLLPGHRRRRPPGPRPTVHGPPAPAACQPPRLVPNAQRWPDGVALPSGEHGPPYQRRRCAHIAVGELQRQGFCGWAPQAGRVGDTDLRGALPESKTNQICVGGQPPFSLKHQQDPLLRGQNERKAPLRRAGCGAEVKRLCNLQESPPQKTALGGEGRSAACPPAGGSGPGPCRRGE